MTHSYSYSGYFIWRKTPRGPSLWLLSLIQIKVKGKRSFVSQNKTFRLVREGVVRPETGGPF